MTSRSRARSKTVGSWTALCALLVVVFLVSIQPEPPSPRILTGVVTGRVCFSPEDGVVVMSDERGGAHSNVLNPGVEYPTYRLMVNLDDTTFYWVVCSETMYNAAQYGDTITFYAGCPNRPVDTILPNPTPLHKP